MIAAALRQIFPPPCAIAVRDANAEVIALPPEEAAIVANAVPKRKREFAAGRDAARAALRELGFAAPVIGCGPDRAPQWPEAAIGSIAHADAHVVAVAARKSEVAAIGVDVERDGAVREEVWRQIMTESEIEALRRFPAEERTRWATVAFCAKEAFYKFQYPLTGAWLEFVAVTVDLDVGAGRFTVFAREPLRAAGFATNAFGGRFVFAGSCTLAGLHLPVGFAAKA